VKSTHGRGLAAPWREDASPAGVKFRGEAGRFAHDLERVKTHEAGSCLQRSAPAASFMIPYVQLRAEDGYRSRAGYKILQNRRAVRNSATRICAF